MALSRSGTAADRYTSKLSMTVRSGLVAVALMFAIASCGSGDNEVERGDGGLASAVTARSQESAVNPADESGRPANAEELEEYEQSWASTDLSLTIEGPAGPVQAGESVEIVLTVGEIVKGSDAQGVAVELELVGLRPVVLLPGCVSGRAGIQCSVPHGPGIDEVDWGKLPALAGPAELVVPLRVDGAVGEEVSIRGVVTSSRNGLDNDPDPSNNSAGYDAEIGG